MMEIISSSDTDMAELTRNIIAAAGSSQARIAEAYSIFDDPVFNEIASPSKVVDRVLLSEAKRKSVDLVAATASLMPTIDAILSDEIQSVENHLSTLFPTNSDLRQDVIAGVKHRLSTEREYYVRQAAILRASFQGLTNFTSFMLDEAGVYEVTPDGRIMFETTSLAERYNSLIAELEETAKQQEKLDMDMMTYQKAVQEEAWTVMSGEKRP
jgi:hypothetical protein